MQITIELTPEMDVLIDDWAFTPVDSTEELRRQRDIKGALWQLKEAREKAKEEAKQKLPEPYEDAEENTVFGKINQIIVYLKEKENA